MANNDKFQVKQKLVDHSFTSINRPNPDSAQPPVIIELSSSDSDSDSDSSSDDDDEVRNSGKRSRELSADVSNGKSKKKKVAGDLPVGFLDLLPSRRPPLGVSSPSTGNVGSIVMAPVQKVIPAVDGSNRQFWKAGDYEGTPAVGFRDSHNAFAELLDNSLDEVCSGATHVNLDMVKNKKDGTKMLLVEEMGKKDLKLKKVKGKIVENVKGKKVKQDERKSKSSKESYSRCSPTYFRDVLDEVLPNLGNKQKERIKSTPLAPWLEMPEMPISSTRIDLVLKRFQQQPSRSFVFGDNIVVPFTSIEFSVVLGLAHVGQPVDLDASMESKFVARLFGGKVSNVNRTTIHDNMRLLVGSKKDSDVDDFLRLFICLLFNCVIFPVSNYSTPRFIMSYIDNLTRFFDYSWGDAAYRFLCHQIILHTGNGKGNVASKMYVDGCTVGLMAWLYERIPSFGHARSLCCFPRLFRWDRSKISIKCDAAERLFTGIDFSRVLDIVPLPDEEILLSGKQGSSSVARCVRCSGFANARRMIEPTAKEFCDVGKGETDVESASGADKSNDEEEEKVSADLGSEKDNLNVEENENIEVEVSGEDELAGLFDLKAEGNVGSTAKFDDDNVDLMVQNVSQLDKENKELVVFDPRNASADERDNGTDSNVDVRNSVDGFEEKKNVLGADFGSGSSEDHVKKRKPSMFVTLPSSTPKHKMKGKKQSFVDVDKEGKTSAKTSMDAYKARGDFCGHEEASDEQRKLLTDFLSREELDVIIWQDELLRLTGPIFCSFLFGDPVDGEILNVYMRIMKKHSPDYGFEIYCMDTIVQKEVFQHLELYGRHRQLRRTDYGAFLDRLTSTTRGRLQELNEDLFRKCRYIIFPINDRWHWYLLVFKASEGKFRLWNSNHDSFAVETAKVYARFLAGCMLHLSGFALGSHEVLREQCRQQGATLDCGVYACIWLECLSRDTDDIWRFEKDVKMNTYRARVASTILSDANGLLKNTFE